MPIYSAVALVLAVCMTIWLGGTYPVHAWLPVVVLMALTAVTENFAFELPLNGSVSLSFALIYAALLYAGPLAAVLCALAASITLKELRSQISLSARIFNIAQLSLAAGLSGVSYFVAGGQMLADMQQPAVALSAASTAALVFYSLNVLFVAVFVSLLKREPFLVVLRTQGFISYAASLVVLALLGVMVAALLVLHSWIGLVLLVLPFMAARRTFRVYAELTEAYTSTVRSLVTAIEAKDPYTKGHSERVAIYARHLAGALHLSRSQAELIERAALLHDVGKIGIPLDTLTSPTQLSSEEIRLIRQHPDVGSRLVSDVEFLSDIVPVIRHHHERVDGSGYPSGLIGEEIPMLSRLLAVADAYDAMTSTRAYRLAMSTDAAVAEITRVAGGQLDGEMAKMFIQLLDSRAFGADSDG